MPLCRGGRRLGLEGVSSTLWIFTSGIEAGFNEAILLLYCNLEKHDTNTLLGYLSNEWHINNRQMAITYNSLTPEVTCSPLYSLLNATGNMEYGNEQMTHEIIYR